jgi:pimeloyl-ACP methyl ester carboxylesterase
MSHQGNSLLISWIKRPLGLSDPSSATATVVFAPSGTDIGAVSEPRMVLTQPGCTEFTLMLVSLLNGIIENFIASTDWRPIEQVIRVDLSVDVREYTARIKTPTLLVTAKHDQIVPPAYSENLVPDAKTVELNSGHLIFLEKPVELASAILSFCQ